MKQIKIRHVYVYCPRTNDPVWLAGQIYHDHPSDQILKRRIDSEPAVVDVSVFYFYLTA
jgi:hypothetical protein